MDLNNITDHNGINIEKVEEVSVNELPVQLTSAT